MTITARIYDTALLECIVFTDIIICMVDYKINIDQCAKFNPFLQITNPPIYNILV